MNGSKLLRILSSFDEKEWRACHKYLKYSNKKEANSLKLFEYIFKYRSQLDSPKLRRALVLRKVVPDLNEKALLNLLSHLSKDVESFMVHREIDKPHRSFDKKKMLAEIYRKKGMNNIFEAQLRILKKQLEQVSDLDLFKSLKKSQLFHLEYFSEGHMKHIRSNEILEKAKTELTFFSKIIDKYYSIELANSQKITTNIYKRHEEPEVKPVETLISELESLVQNNSVEGFDYLEKTLYNNHAKMSQEVSESILIYLTNFCLYDIKKGNESRILNLSQLYNFGLKTGILLFGGKLAETRFLTIVEVVAKSGTIKKPAHFIEKWIDSVETSDRQSVINLANAHWHFTNKEYRKTLEAISLLDTKLNNVNFAFRERWLRICSLCSTYPDHEGKKDILNAASTFFRRHKSKVGVLPFTGSMNLVKLVGMFWSNSDTKEITAFIDSCDYLIFRSWAKLQLRNGPSS